MTVYVFIYFFFLLCDQLNNIGTIFHLKTLYFERAVKLSLFYAHIIFSLTFYYHESQQSKKSQSQCLLHIPLVVLFNRSYFPSFATSKKKESSVSSAFMIRLVGRRSHCGGGGGGDRGGKSRG